MGLGGEREFNSTDLLNRHLLLSLNSCCYPRLRLLRLRFMALCIEENCFTVLVCFTLGKCGLWSKQNIVYNLKYILILSGAKCTSLIESSYNC